MLWIANAGPGDWEFWYIAPTYKEARSIFWRRLKKALRDAGWIVGQPNESRLEIDLVTGARVSLKGADNPDSLRGMGVKGALFDEFATMKVEAWTEAVGPALSDQDGEAVFLGTPQSYNHLHELYLLGQQGEDEWASWQFKTIDGAVEPWGPMKRAEIDSARRRMDARTFQQEFEASFEALTGRVYYGFARTDHVKPVWLETQAPVFVSFDFNIDPATAVIGQERDGKSCVWKEVFLTHRGGEATLSAARAVRKLLGDAGHAGAVSIYGDSTGKAGKTTGPSDHQVIRSEFPTAIWRIPHGQPHVKDRISAVNGRCRTAQGGVHLSVDPSCIRLITDLEGVQFTDKGEIDKATNPVLSHVSDALGYWIVREFPPIKKDILGGSRWGL